MATNCRIVYTDGVAGVFNGDNTPSALFNEALEYYKNQDQALEAWMVVNSQMFQDEVGITPENAVLADVLDFLSNKSISNTQLTSGELSEVLQFMRTNGITTLNELDTKLNKVFKPNGYFEVSTRVMVDSGMWLQEEADSINPKSMMNLLNKITSTNLSTDISLVNQSSLQRITIKNINGEKTILGTYKDVAIEDIVQYAMLNSPSKNVEDIKETLSVSPNYSYVSDKMEDSPLLTESIMEIVNSKMVVPKVYHNGDTITTENLSERKTVENTVLLGADSVEIEADAEFLESISLEVWESNKPEIKRIVRRIEQSLIKFNVDVIGLSEIAEFDRQGAIVMIESARELVENPSSTSITRFTEVKEEILGRGANMIVIPNNEAYSDLNIVHLETTLSPGEIFDNFGLVKVEGNHLYHAVNINRDEAYDALYEMFKNGELNIPQNMFFTEDPFAVENIDSTMESIRNYVKSRDVGFEVENQEDVSLSQILFRYVTPTRHKVPSKIIENSEYLTTDFISDFYQYILSEKIKDSDLYDKVLKHFYVSDTDINLNALTTPDIRGIKYEQELRDYAELKKEGQIKELVTEVNAIEEDIQAINNPQYISEIQGEFKQVMEAEYIISAPNVNTYTRVGNNVYRKVFTNLKGEVYKRLNIPPNNVYFNVDMNFDTNISEAEKLLNDTTISPTFASAASIKLQTKTPNTLQGTNNKVRLQELEQAVVQLNKTGLATKVELMDDKQIKSYLKSLGLGEEQVKFIIDNKNNQIDRVFDIKVSTDRLKELMQNETSINLSEIFDITSLKGLEKTKLKFTVNDASEISGGISLTPTEVLNLEITYPRYLLDRSDESIRNAVFSILSHETQHIHDRGIARSYGDNTQRVTSKVQNKFGNVSSKIDTTSPRVGERKLDPNTGVALGIYLSNEGERRARLNELQEANIPVEFYNLHEPAIEDRLVWSNFDNVKEEDLQRYYEIGNSYYFDTRSVYTNPTVQYQGSVKVTPNGFVHNGKVFLNSDKADVNTAIHEFSHLYTGLLKQTNSAVYNRGLQLIEQEGQAYVNFVKINQPELKGEALLDEALNQAVGDSGARIVNQESKGRFLDYLNELWNSIKGMLGLSAYTMGQVNDMTLQEYTNAVAVDLLGGENLGRPIEDNNVRYLFDQDVIERSDLTPIANQTVKDILEYNQFYKSKKLIEGGTNRTKPKEFVENSKFNTELSPMLNLGKPSEILKGVGFRENVPIEISLEYFQEHIVENLRHELTSKDVAEIMRGIHSPIAVYKNAEYGDRRADRFEILTPLQNRNGDNIVVILEKDRVTDSFNKEEGRRLSKTRNAVVTAFSVGNTSRLDNAIDSNGLLFFNKNKFEDSYLGGESPVVDRNKPSNLNTKLLNILNKTSKFKNNFNINDVQFQKSGTLSHNGSTLHYKPRINPITDRPTGEIEIDLIETPQEKRGQGNAKELLTQLTNLADEQRISLYLFASPRDLNTSTEGLINLYKSYGFTTVDDFMPEEMIRKPKTAKTQAITNVLTQLTPEELLSVSRSLNITLPTVQDYISVGELSYTNEEGKPCAKMGGKSNFTRGGKWKIVKEIKGSSHERGGVDIELSNNGVKIKNNNSEIKAKNGLVIGKVL